MGNGGVYGMNNNYFAAAAAADSANYTPHLLPMFQQSQGYHNLNDPNHLEDASVLLSMAYPGGVPAGGENNQNNRSGSGMTVGGQTVVPDWEGSQTINMMMESAAEAEAASRTNSVGSTNGDISSANAAVLPESMGNFLGTMNWLISATGALNNKDGNSGEAANAWVSEMVRLLTRAKRARSRRRWIRAHPSPRRLPTLHRAPCRHFRSRPSSPRRPSV
jgi:hypothetical protein